MVRPILEPGKEVEGLAKLATVVKTPGHIREVFKAVSDVVGTLFENRAPLVLRVVPPSRRFPHGDEGHSLRARPAVTPFAFLSQPALNGHLISREVYVTPEYPIAD